MTQMRALVATGVGEPDEVLVERSVPVPAPGPGEVLVRVLAAPIHPSDLHIIRGRYGFAPEFPTVVGVESVGIVEALGPGVDRLETGQRVVSLGVTGTWQEFFTAPAERLLPVPDELDDSTACQLIVNPLTAWLLVDEELRVGPGEWLVQTAASSTVGKLVLQLAQVQGFRTINVVRRPAAVAEVEALDGTATICTGADDVLERVQAITGPEVVTKAIDAVAGQVGADVLRALAPGGEMIVYGALATHRQTDPDRLTLPLFARSVIFGTRAVRGFWLFRWFATQSPERIRSRLDQIVRLVASGALEIPEGQPHGLDEGLAAVRLAEAPAHGSKPLLVFEGP